MRALDGFDVQVKAARGGVRPDCGVPGVGEGAGLAVAEAGDVVLVAAEGLLFGRSGWGLVWALGEQVRAAYLSLNEQNCCPMTCHTISSEAMVGELLGMQGEYGIECL